MAYTLPTFNLKEAARKAKEGLLKNSNPSYIPPAPPLPPTVTQTKPEVLFTFKEPQKNLVKTLGNIQGTQRAPTQVSDIPSKTGKDEGYYTPGEFVDRNNGKVINQGENSTVSRAYLDYVSPKLTSFEDDQRDLYKNRDIVRGLQEAGRLTPEDVTEMTTKQSQGGTRESILANMVAKKRYQLGTIEKAPQSITHNNINSIFSPSAKASYLSSRSAADEETLKSFIEDQKAKGKSSDYIRNEIIRLNLQMDIENKLYEGLSTMGKVDYSTTKFLKGTMNNLFAEIPRVANAVMSLPTPSEMLFGKREGQKKLEEWGDEKVKDVNKVLATKQRGLGFETGVTGNKDMSLSATEIVAELIPFFLQPELAIPKGTKYIKAMQMLYRSITAPFIIVPAGTGELPTPKEFVDIAALNLIGEGIFHGAGKYINKFGNDIGISGLFNRAGIKKIKTIMADEGLDVNAVDNEYIFSWLKSREIPRGGKDEMIRRTQQFATEKSADFATKTMDDAGAFIKDEGHISGTLEKIISKIKNSKSPEERAILKKVQDLLAKTKRDGGLTASEANAIKRMNADYLNPFQKNLGGTVIEKNVDDAALYRGIKNQLEEEGAKVGVDMRAINKEVSEAKAILDGLKNKVAADTLKDMTSADLTRKFGSFTLRGAIKSQVGPFDNDTKEGMVSNWVFWTLGGKVLKTGAKYTVQQTQFTNFIGRMMTVLSPKQTSAIADLIQTQRFTQAAEEAVNVVRKEAQKAGLKMLPAGTRELPPASGLIDDAKGLIESPKVPEGVDYPRTDPSAVSLREVAGAKMGTTVGTAKTPIVPEMGTGVGPVASMGSSVATTQGSLQRTLPESNSQLVSTIAKPTPEASVQSPSNFVGTGGSVVKGTGSSNSGEMVNAPIISKINNNAKPFSTEQLSQAGNPDLIPGKTEIGGPGSIKIGSKKGIAPTGPKTMPAKKISNPKKISDISVFHTYDGFEATYKGKTLGVFQKEPTQIELQKIIDNVPKQNSSVISNIATPKTPAQKKFQTISNKYPETPEVSVAQVQEVLGFNFPVKVVERINTPQGKKALGMYYNGAIEISQNPTATTGYHEAFHGWLEIHGDASLRSQAEAQLAKMGIKDSLKQEEHLAEAFADWKLKGKTFTGAIKKLLENAWESIKGVFGKQDKVNKLFRSVGKKGEGTGTKSAVGKYQEAEHEVIKATVEGKPVMKINGENVVGKDVGNGIIEYKTANGLVTDVSSSTIKNEGVIVIGGDRVQWNEMFKPQKSGIDYVEHNVGWATSQSIASGFTKTAAGGKNVVIITQNNNVVGSVKGHRTFASEVERRVQENLGPKEFAVFKKAFDKIVIPPTASRGDKMRAVYNTGYKSDIKAGKYDSISQYDVAIAIQHPEAEITSGKILGVGIYQGHRIGDARTIGHTDYPAEINFSSFIRFGKPMEMSDLVASIKDPTKREYWAIMMRSGVLNLSKADSPIVEKLMMDMSTDSLKKALSTTVKSKNLTQFKKLVSQKVGDLKDESKSYLNTGEYGILTSDNPAAKKVTIDENIANRIKLQNDIKAMGYDYIRIEGKYGNTESSFMIPGISEADLVKLGDKYGQESVITNKKKLYTQGVNKGKYEPRLEGVTFDQKAEDLYSVISTQGERVKFSLRFGEMTGNAPVVAKAPLKPLPNTHIQKGVDSYAKKYGFSVQHNNYVTIDEAFSRKTADAYTKMKSDNSADPVVKKAYEALGAEVRKQWDFITKDMGIKMEGWTKDGQPYANSTEMANDVRDNKHLYFFTGGDPHPFLDKTDKVTGYNGNEMLRAIHDIFGHSSDGFGFGARGEENAFLKHSQMFSPEAQRALATETRGQNSWVNYGKQNYNKDGTYKNIPAHDRPYAEQKVDLLPLEFSSWKDKLPNGIIKKIGKAPAKAKTNKYLQKK